MHVRLATANSQSATLQTAADDHLLNVRDQRNRVLVLVKCARRTPHELRVLDLALASQLDQRSSTPNTNTLRASHVNRSRSSRNPITALDHDTATQHSQAVAKRRTARAANVGNRPSECGGHDAASLDIGGPISGDFRSVRGHVDLL